MKKIVNALFIVIVSLLFITPTFAENNETAVEIGVKSDYNRFVVESKDGKDYVSDSKLTLKYTDVGNHKYSIYVEDNPTNKYDLDVFVGRKEDNSLYTETVLVKDSDKTTKISEIEFKKPAKPTNDDIGTGVVSNPILWVALIPTSLILIYLLNRNKSKDK